MTKKITGLGGKEHILDEVRREFLERGLATGPCDRKAVEAACDQCYRTAGLEPPELRIWTDSPRAAVLAIAALRKQKPEYGSPCFGSMDAGWLSFYEVFRRLGLECVAPLQGLLGMLECGWWYAFDKAVVFSERPDRIAVDDNGDLHCEDGAAVLYRDGFGVWAIHGVRVPQMVVEQPEQITLETIRAEQNAEVRRVMRERYGEGRYLSDIKAKVIDTDSVPTDALAPKGPSIVRALIEDDEGTRFLVGSDGSTKRVYYMQVPSECKTCVEAYAALRGSDREVRTIVEA